MKNILTLLAAVLMITSCCTKPRKTKVSKQFDGYELIEPMTGKSFRLQYLKSRGAYGVQEAVILTDTVMVCGDTSVVTQTIYKTL